MGPSVGGIMAKGFHEKEFDHATQVKLAIFRGYIREWLPVFLTDRSSGQNVETVNVFDFFAGPGIDAAGNPGSPRIVQEELRDFCETHHELKAEGVHVNLLFSDKKKSHVSQLKQCLAEKTCPKGCCSATFLSLPFHEAFGSGLSVMRRPRSANLVIMDQFGVKEVTPEVVNALAQCPTTDILFFISSSYIRRFADEPAFQDYFKLGAEELAASEYNSIHRLICDYFRSRLRRVSDYHLAPFSIRKGSNIYGVIFGSRNLLGLEKFLKVCWALDGVTGEANYDIDGDPIRRGQLSLFPEDNVPKKEMVFQRELEKLLAGSTAHAPVDNRKLYRFTLERGFLPTQTRTYLMSLQKEGRLQVNAVGSGKPPRIGDFYLRDKESRAVFFVKE